LASTTRESILNSAAIACPIGSIPVSSETIGSREKDEVNPRQSAQRRRRSSLPSSATCVNVRPRRPHRSQTMRLGNSSELEEGGSLMLAFYFGDRRLWKRLSRSLLNRRPWFLFIGIVCA